MQPTQEKQIQFLGFVPSGHMSDVKGPCVLSIKLTKSEIKELIELIGWSKHQTAEQLGYLGSVYRSYRGFWRDVTNPTDLGLSSQAPWVVEPDDSKFIGRHAPAADETHVRWATPEGVYWAATLKDGRNVRTLPMSEDYLLDNIYSVLERLAQIEPDEPASDRPMKPGAYILTLMHEGKEVDISALVHFPTPNSSELHVLLGEDPKPYRLSQIKLDAKWRRL